MHCVSCEQTLKDEKCAVPGNEVHLGQFDAFLCKNRYD